MAENRVQFGLKNCHYAVLTTTITDGVETYTYGTPVAIPGGVTLTLDPAGEVTPFYADNIVYYQSVANNGYSGDLEVARFPDSFYTDIFGFTETQTSKVLMENSQTEPKEFALLYQIDGDASNECYVLYKCSATRPGTDSVHIINEIGEKKLSIVEGGTCRSTYPHFFPSDGYRLSHPRIPKRTKPF